MKARPKAAPKAAPKPAPKKASRAPKAAATKKAAPTKAHGPKAPAGKEANWVQTIPGKAWFTILRLYGPLEPWFNKTWRPDDIRLVK